jgi:hypothetical protein
MKTDFPNTPHGNVQSAMQTLFRLQALMRMLILIDDDNSLSKLGEMYFIETIQTTAETGVDLVGNALHFVSLVELQTNDDVDGLEDRFTLPVLLSAVLRHADAPEWLAKGIGELLGENNAIEPDSSEYIAVALGLEVKE